MKWFKKEPKAVDVLLRMQTTAIQVQHTIERKPDPIPLSGRYRVYDPAGRYWDTTGFLIHGRQSMKTFIPRAWLTGDTNDHENIAIELLLEY